MLHTSSAPAHIVIWRTNIAEGFAPQESGCFQLSHSRRRIRLRGRMVGSGCISILSGGCINYKERRAQWRKLETQLVGTAALKIPAAYYHLTMPR
jgi:hypothetical protein